MTPGPRKDGNLLSLVFECPPRWLGIPNRSCDIRDWKPRFNYTWDWIPRLVQVGVWDEMTIEVTDGPAIDSVRLWTDRDPVTGRGSARIFCSASGAGQADLVAEVTDPAGTVIGERRTALSGAAAELLFDGLTVEPWNPNGAGSQPLYGLRMSLRDAGGVEHDRYERRIGFKSVAWKPCGGAPAGADPWLCEVNGRPLFLQGVNWTPLRPFFADVTEEEVRARLRVYKAMGCNLMRVWGGAVVEKESFYDLCDSMGFLVWQELPFSGSGPENTPPSDPAFIAEAGAIAASYVERRQRHVSLLLWCGGNELQTALDGGPGQGRPLDNGFPLLKRLSEVVHEMDPGRRFLPTSSSGPREFADSGSYGKGLHWDVHGPWKMDGGREEWQRYWRDDDSLFRSEVGSPGCSPAELIQRTSGGLPAFPGSLASPLWKRTSFWWLEWDVFTREKGREPESLEEYVSWSQERQAFALVTAARRCKERFPSCGGFIVWMGHDSFPCCANTSIVDFDGNPKPAALALGEVFRG
jgi:beta-mannosidase